MKWIAATERCQLPSLKQKYQRLGGEVGDLQKSGSGEFNGNGGRRTGLLYPMKVLARLARERLRLGVYMKMRRDRDTAEVGSQVAADRASQRLARRQERNGLPRREASPVLWRDGVF